MEVEANEVHKSLERVAHADALQQLSLGNSVGSRVRLLTTLSTRQKALRKQTESLQRGERRMCAM